MVQYPSKKSMLLGWEYCKATDASRKWNLKKLGTPAVKYISVGNDNLYVAVYPEKIVVCIAGTNECKDWIGFAGNLTTSLNQSGKHTGFFHATYAIWKEIKKYFEWRQIYCRFKGTDKIVKKKIYVYGHSRGGAIAILLAELISTAYDCNVYGLVYGAPRVYSENYNAGLLEKIKLWRIECDFDPVVCIPYIGYRKKYPLVIIVQNRMFKWFGRIFFSHLRYGFMIRLFYRNF